MNFTNISIIALEPYGLMSLEKIMIIHISQVGNKHIVEKIEKYI